MAKDDLEEEEEEDDIEDDDSESEDSYQATTNNICVKMLPPYPGNKDSFKLKEWHRIYNRYNYARNRATRLEYSKKYESSHKDQKKRNNILYYGKNRSKILSVNAVGYMTNRRKKRLAIRLDLVDTLGRVCVKCGFSDIRALCVDHIHGGGTLDRLTRGANYYKYYLEHPDEAEKVLQILCANCDRIKKSENKEYFRKNRILGELSTW